MNGVETENDSKLEALQHTTAFAPSIQSDEVVAALSCWLVLDQEMVGNMKSWNLCTSLSQDVVLCFLTLLLTYHRLWF